MSETAGHVDLERQILSDLALKTIAERYILAKLDDPMGSFPTGGTLLSRGEVGRINELIKRAQIVVSF